MFGVHHERSWALYSSAVFHDIALLHLCDLKMLKINVPICTYVVECLHFLHLYYAGYEFQKTRSAC